MLPLAYYLHTVDHGNQILGHENLKQLQVTIIKIKDLICLPSPCPFRQLRFYQRILIEDLINYKSKYLINGKNQDCFFSRECIFFVLPIFRKPGTAFLLQRLHTNDKVKLRRYNLKWKDSVQCDTIITCKKKKRKKKKKRTLKVYENKIR